jgi:alpha-beta hydrolase superfamily lysophospholipase
MLACEVQDMAKADRFVARRAVIKGAGLAVGGGLMSGLAPAAMAQQKEPGAALWSGDYWAKKGDVSLCLYRKRVGAPVPAEPARPVLFLVHGSSISSRPTFDLDVPGRGEYSLMNVFARRGFDVWTMDHENYGRSSRTSGNSDIASGVEDLKAATEVVRRETGRERMHFCGESSGALRAGAFAMVEPGRVDRLVLLAFTYKGEGSPTLAKRAEALAFYRSHNMRPRDRNMIRSIFTRDKPGTSEPEVGEALADQELKFGEEAPTGTYLDMTANLPVVDPLKVHAPVLLARGEHDGIATVDDLSAFFKLLPNGDRQFVIMPGLAHSLVLATNRQLFWHVMHAFLTMPAPVAT